MKKVLITGGSGTIGRAFIEKYYNVYEFYSYSRNELFQHNLKKHHPNVINIVGAVEEKSALINSFQKIKPDIVIHAAAMKHIDIAEENPIQCVNSNIIGSLNVIEASILCQIPITIAISTDKACESDNVYGMTKSLMEKCFVDVNNNTTKFSVCRFANVINSNGSVIPFWLKLKEDNMPLKLTDPKMNRLMFSQDEAAALIKKSIDICELNDGGFILSKKMKTVNMLELAQTISNSIEIINKRPGEKLDEVLISKKEINFSYLIEDDYVMLKKEKNIGTNKLLEEISSSTSEKMTNLEMKQIINL